MSTNGVLGTDKLHPNDLVAAAWEDTEKGFKLNLRHYPVEMADTVKERIRPFYESHVSNLTLYIRPYPTGQRGALTGQELDAIEADAIAMATANDAYVWRDLGCVYFDCKTPTEDREAGRRELDRLRKVLEARPDWEIHEMVDGYAIVLPGCQVWGV